MKILATTTVIRGTGACEVFMNDVLNKEIAKMNENHNAKIREMWSELQASNNHRNDLLANRLEIVRAALAKPTSTISRIKEWFEITWCKFWGLCEVAGLWKHGSHK